MVAPVFASQSTLVCLCVKAPWKTSLMSSSLAVPSLSCSSYLNGF